MMEGVGMNASDTLPAITRWALERVRHHLRRYGYRLLQPAGSPAGLFVGVDEARAVLDGRSDFDLAHALGLDTAAVPTGDPLDAHPPLADLCRRLRLTPLDARILLAAVAPHLSADVARLYTFALADFTRKLPPAGFIAELVTDTPEDATTAHAAFRPDAPLLHHGLLALALEPPFGPDAPPSRLGVITPAAVVAHLRGEPPPLTPALADAIEPEPGPRLAADEPDAALVDRVRARFAALEARVLFIGERGAGRRRLYRAALGPDRSPLTVDLDRLPTEPDALASLLAEAARAALLTDRPLLLRADAVLADAGDLRLPALAAPSAATPAPSLSPPATTLARSTPSSTCPPCACPHPTPPASATCGPGPSPPSAPTTPRCPSTSCSDSPPPPAPSTPPPAKPATAPGSTALRSTSSTSPPPCAAASTTRSTPSPSPPAPRSPGTTSCCRPKCSTGSRRVSPRRSSSGPAIDHMRGRCAIQLTCSTSPTGASEMARFREWRSSGW